MTNLEYRIREAAKLNDHRFGTTTTEEQIQARIAEYTKPAVPARAQKARRHDDLYNEGHRGGYNPYRS